jgi:dihydrofolate reductase
MSLQNITDKYKVVIASNLKGVIGRNKKLPWSSKEDLEHFKALTLGHTIVMGRKTFESLGRLLPDRCHVVVSNNVAYRHKKYRPDIVVTDLYEPLLVSKAPHFLIGGAQVLKTAFELDLVDLVYHTKVYDNTDGDVLMPEIPDSFTLLSSFKKDANPALEFEVWKKNGSEAPSP